MLYRLLDARTNSNIELMNDHDLTCKKTIYHKFKDVAVLLGEIDLIDWSEETLIDIKCSESDFKLEWYVQLLIYLILSIIPQPLSLNLQVLLIIIFSLSLNPILHHFVPHFLVSPLMIDV